MCLQLMRDVHAHDGYPMDWPNNPGRFTTPPYERGAWVGVQVGRVVGHVALHADDRDPVLDSARRATGLSAEHIAVVARLLVSPMARHEGIEKALMTRATTEAHLHGLRPVLDVAKHYDAAIALFEACGWTRADDLTLRLRTGLILDSWLYIGPAANA